MTERRKDFRIIGRAQVQIKLIEPPPGESECARGYFMSEELMAFATAYEDLCNRSSEAMARLRNSDTGLSDVLSLLDQKLDLIEQRFHLSNPSESNPSEKASLKDVSLSVSGMSFLHSQAYNEGADLAIRLTLLPGHSLIYSLAKCTRCKPHKKGGFQIATRFSHLGNQEGKLLRRHIMQMEREQLRGSAAV